MMKGGKIFEPWDRVGHKPEIEGTCLPKLGPADGILFEKRKKKTRSKSTRGPMGPTGASGASWRRRGHTGRIRSHQEEETKGQSVEI